MAMNALLIPQYNLYVIADICQKERISDKKLGAVAFTALGEPTKYQSYEPQYPEYHKVEVLNFQGINFQLVDADGEPLVFMDAAAPVALEVTLKRFG